MQVHGAEPPQLAGDGPEAAVHSRPTDVPYKLQLHCCDRERRKKEQMPLDNSPPRCLSSRAVIHDANNCSLRFE